MVVSLKESIMFTFCALHYVNRGIVNELALRMGLRHNDVPNKFYLPTDSICKPIRNNPFAALSLSFRQNVRIITLYLIWHYK